MPLPREPRKAKPFDVLREKTNHERSQAQESSVAETFSGKVQPASGSRPFKKGDVISDAFLVECKTTKKKSYSLTAPTLRKIFDEAFAAKRRACLVVQFEGAIEKGYPKQWAVLPIEVLRELLQ